MSILDKIISIEKEIKDIKGLYNKKDFSYASGKGVYIYFPESIYTEEGGIDKAIQSFKKIGYDNVWIRIMGKKGWSQTQTKEQAKLFIKKCNDVGIKVGAWGFIYDPDDQPEKYAHYVAEFVKEFDFKLFVHNAEYDQEDDSIKVEREHAEKYWEVINKEIPDIVHGLSTYWSIDHHPNFPYDVYMKNCDFITPQIYHTVKDPIPVLRKGIEINSRFNKPINVTLQAFWSEMGITEESATKDLDKICNLWNTELKDIVIDKKVIGVTCWHAGGKGENAMNEKMEESYSKFKPILSEI